MRIESGAQSLQMLKAQQAWEARRASKPQAPASELPSSRIEIETPAAMQSQPLSPQWQRKVNDIQTIATKAGFVGVTEQNIRRAYQQGESLLADYRV